MDLRTARRSCLSVPGSSERMLAKAPGLEADEVVLDLEDAVAVDGKEQGRALVVEALAGESYARGSPATTCPRSARRSPAPASPGARTRRSASSSPAPARLDRQPDVPDGQPTGRRQLPHAGITAGPRRRATTPSLRSAALGQDTEPILADVLGLSAGEVGRLHDAGIVASPSAHAVS